MTHADVVKITGLKVDSVIGVFEWERAITQPLVIDVELYTDISKAARSDAIEDAINYKSVADDITMWCMQAKAKLIERLANLIASNILSSYPVVKVAVTVTKPTALKNAEVSVSIIRTLDELSAND